MQPLNLVMDEEAKTFRLIDLGAASDLRYGYGYVPDERYVKDC